MLIFKVTVRDSFPTQTSPLTPSINFGFCKKLWNRYAIFNTKAIKTKVFHSFFLAPRILILLCSLVHGL